MQRFILTLTAIASLFIAAGCGQSGPLYLPGNPSRIETPPPASPGSGQQPSEQQPPEQQDEKEKSDTSPN